MIAPALATSGEEKAARGFDPALDADPSNEWVGKRRQKRKSIPETVLWAWPSQSKARLQAFDDWHDVAMQIVHRAESGFRLMAVYEKVIRWVEGCIIASDQQLAEAAGRCSWKTISREIKVHRELGIIRVDHGWRRGPNGKMLRTREIRLALPAALDPGIVVRELPNHMDTRGPHGEANHTDTRAANHMDTRGPITLATREEGDRIDGSA